MVLNNGEELTEEDRKLFEAIKDLEYIVIVNKTDLPTKLDRQEVEQLAGKQKVITTALIEDKGIDALEAAISDTFFEGELDSGDLSYVSNVRHIQLLQQTLKALDDAKDAIDANMPIDLVK